MIDVTFFCYYSDGLSKHQANISLADIPKWIECYKFTHPNCRAISVKVWFGEDVL